MAQNNNIMHLLLSFTTFHRSSYVRLYRKHQIIKLYKIKKHDTTRHTNLLANPTINNSLCLLKSNNLFQKCPNKFK